MSITKISSSQGLPSESRAQDPKQDGRLLDASATPTWPKIWFGHDLKSPLRVWTHVRGCPGVIISAHQVLMRGECFLRKCGDEGIHSHLDYHGPIFLDSGGFHFQQHGRSSIAVSDLLRTQAVLRPNVTAVLDAPLHPRASSQENARRWRQTLENSAEMLARSRSSLALVLHSHNAGHTSRRCQQLRLLVSEPAVVCVGSLVPLLRGQGVADKFVSHNAKTPKTQQRWRFITRLIQIVRTSFPNAILHVFGAGTLSSIWFFYALGADSVDSVAWRLKAAYGAIRLPGLGDRYVADFAHTRTRRRASAQCLKVLAACRCSVCDGFQLRRRKTVLAESFQARAVHNAQVFIDEVNAFRDAASRGNHLEFIYGRLKDNPRYRELFTRTIVPSLSPVAP